MLLHPTPIKYYDFDPETSPAVVFQSMEHLHNIKLAAMANKVAPRTNLPDVLVCGAPKKIYIFVPITIGIATAASPGRYAAFLTAQQFETYCKKLSWIF